MNTNFHKTGRMLMEHMSVNDLFTPHQYRFRSGRSCVTPLSEVLEHWTDLLDNGRNIHVDVIYLDFRKAFDTVLHKRLLHKMEAYDIQGDVLDWVRAYLEEGQRRVVFGNNYSEAKLLGDRPASHHQLCVQGE
jgi:hypothetical protein